MPDSPGPGGGTGAQLVQALGSGLRAERWGGARPLKRRSSGPRSPYEGPGAPMRHRPHATGRRSRIGKHYACSARGTRSPCRTPIPADIPAEQRLASGASPIRSSAKKPSSPVAIWTDDADLLGPALLAGVGLAIQPKFLVWQPPATGRWKSPCRTGARRRSRDRPVIPRPLFDRRVAVPLDVRVREGSLTTKSRLLSRGKTAIPLCAPDTCRQQTAISAG